MSPSALTKMKQWLSACSPVTRASNYYKSAIAIINDHEDELELPNLMHRIDKAMWITYFLRGLESLHNSLSNTIDQLCSN